MRGYAFWVALLTSLVGCAQTPTTGSLGSKPTTKNFDTCGLSVRFSGKPQEVLAGYLSKFANVFGSTEGTGWIYSSIAGNQLKSEVAMCICVKDEPALSKAKSEFAQLGPLTKFVEGTGYVTEYTAIERADGTKYVSQFAMKSDSNCFLTQVVDAATEQDVADVALPYFSTLAPIPKEPTKSDANPSGKSASERLRQLDQLFKDKLITREEYDTQRKAIVNAL